MNQVGQPEILNYFERYEWAADPFEGNAVLTGFAGETEQYTLFVNCTETWVVLAINPLIPEIAVDCLPQLCAYLAELNFHMTLAKLSVSDDGSVVLSVELPNRNVSYEQFVVALETLCYYAEEQIEPLRLLATEPDAAVPPLVQEV